MLPLVVAEMSMAPVTAVADLLKKTAWLVLAAEVLVPLMVKSLLAEITPCILVAILALLVPVIEMLPVVDVMAPAL